MASNVELDRTIGRPPFWTARLRDFPWWLVAILVGIGYMVFQIATNANYQQTFRIILSGLATTIFVTIAAFLLSLLIGLLAGLGRISRNIVLRNMAIAYIEFIRGVPILVLIFTIALVIVPAVAAPLEVVGVDNNDISMVWRAIIALALIYGAYLGEVFRAGVESIGRGQMEAGRSLGMTHTQSMRYIILPQAIRNVLPAVGNDFIAILKDSSLVSVLAVRDLTQNARLFASTSFRFQESYFILTFFYLTMTLVLSLLLQWLQRRMRRNV